MENIYPATVSVNNAAMAYSISVIASQGLIITAAVKNQRVSKSVFDKLLGDKFDFTTHENGALIYNLACYYAINNNKVAMLAAIKEARKRKTPKKQFVDDADFKNYWSDADFKSAIN